MILKVKKKIRKLLISGIVVVLANTALFAGWDLVEPKPTEFNLYGLHFINKDTGWIATNGDLENDSTFMLYTYDGGKTWNKKRFFKEKAPMIRECFFINSNKGWSMGVIPDSFVIMNTIDGGNSWDVQFNLSNSIGGSINSLYFSNVDHGCAVGQDKVFLTINSGDTWEIIDPTGLSGDFSDIFFLNNTLGWAVGRNNLDRAIIIKTQDGGETWTTKYYGGTGGLNMFGLRSVFFVSEDTGWVAGEGGVIAKTTDGGDNWEIKWGNSSYKNFLSIFFTDNDIGWAAGDSGYVYRIVDSINNVIVTKHDLGTTSNLHDICFTDHNHGWIVGTNGTIFRTEDGGGYPISIKYVSNKFAANANIISSYPNPFINNTKIRYTVRQKGNVTVGIYNLKGEKIKTLVNEMHRQAGEYEVDWDACGVSSGIYYVVMTSEVNDNVSKAKKNIILLKN